MEKVKKPSKKESIDSTLISTLQKVKSKIIAECGEDSDRTASIDRVITRNIKKRQKNS